MIYEGNLSVQLSGTGRIWNEQVVFSNEGENETLGIEHKLKVQIIQ